MLLALLLVAGLLIALLLFALLLVASLLVALLLFALLILLGLLQARSYLGLRCFRDLGTNGDQGKGDQKHSADSSKRHARIEKIRYVKRHRFRHGRPPWLHAIDDILNSGGKGLELRYVA